MAPHSSTLAWRIPWTEEPGRLQSMGSQRVGHDWSNLAAAYILVHFEHVRTNTFSWGIYPFFNPISSTVPIKAVLRGSESRDTVCPALRTQLAPSPDAWLLLLHWPHSLFSSHIPASARASGKEKLPWALQTALFCPNLTTGIPLTGQLHCVGISFSSEENRPFLINSQYPQTFLRVCLHITGFEDVYKYKDCFYQRHKKTKYHPSKIIYIYIHILALHSTFFLIFFLLLITSIS